MTAQNDDFDLPRWQTQHHHDQLSAASAPSQSSYIYSAASQPPPPPPPAALISPQRLPPSGSSRQHRISQLLEQDQQLPSTTSPYLSTGQTQLSRSASFGGS